MAEMPDCPSADYLCYPRRVLSNLCSSANLVGGPTPETDLSDQMAGVDNVVHRDETAVYFGQPAYSTLVDEQHIYEEWWRDGEPYAPKEGAGALGRTLQRHGAQLHHIEDGAYDVVFASHVLEHFLDPLSALREWDRVLRPGGALLLLLPWAADGGIWYDEHKEPATMQELLHLAAVNASFNRPVLRRRAEQILCTAEFSGAPFPYIAREELFSLCRRRPLSAPGDGPNNADCEVDENLVHWHV
eukprot:CAMPEP_0182601394 /NCGR_PEP_ID=MMETSP1324-20130603/91465_1 /TAXON_ID=236786 /ORGANISM="Florenciella sp., Strain RCC1587" /LENGTH=243 /DNA_ID=CAMNT_0024819305 /DNA_START=429 /DNA_END=1162 /DNA_ORIENTATION=-